MSFDAKYIYKIVTVKANGGGSVDMKFQVQLQEVHNIWLFYDVVPPMHICA